MRLLLKVHFYTVTVHRAFSILSICNLCIVSEGRNSFYFTLVFGFCWDHFLKYSIFNKYLRNFVIFLCQKRVYKKHAFLPLSAGHSHDHEEHRGGEALHHRHHQYDDHLHDHLDDEILDIHLGRTNFTEIVPLEVISSLMFFNSNFWLN